MSARREPSLVEIVAVWHMAFGEPPVVKAEAALLIEVLRRHYPDVLMILGPEPALGAADSSGRQA